MNPINNHSFLRWLTGLALGIGCLICLNFGAIMHADMPLTDPVLLDSQDIEKFTNDDLRKLVAPIALYPDALIAQVLPASTYPLQVIAAYRHVQTSKDPTHPPSKANWDSSVVALLNYPTILKKMNDDLDWTEKLGLAVTYQMNEVSDTIQQVRAEAHAAGNLVSNDKQSVIQDKEVIRVVPANPEIIYVPEYDPDIIYFAHASWEPYISFGIGFGVGVWLDDFWDWHYHRFCRFHEWRSGGWHHSPRPIYWHAPYRNPPSRYQRSSAGPAVPGARSGRTFAPGTPDIKSLRPAPHVRSSGAAEGLGGTGQETRRESIRGQSSRQIYSQPPRTFTPSHQNMLIPSDRQTVQRESSRGSASRGGGNVNVGTGRHR